MSRSLAISFNVVDCIDTLIYTNYQEQMFDEE